MTERSNDAPDDDAPVNDAPDSPVDEGADDAVPVGDEIAEEARDLSDAELDTAADAAEEEVVAEEAGEAVEDDIEDELEDDAEADEHADEDADDDAEATDEEIDEDEEDEVAAIEAAPLPRGARARAEALRERDRAVREARAAAEARRNRRNRLGRRVERDQVAKPTSKQPFPIDPALRIKDPVSTAFVVATIVVFLGIFLYAMAFGKSGAFTPVRTPRPQPSIVLPSGSPGASGSAAPTGSAAPGSPPPSAQPSGSPTAS